MTLVYSAMNNIGDTVVTFVSNGVEQNLHLGGIISPIVTPILHAYFDLFSGLIQTVVFLFLSMIFIANEGPEDDEEFVTEGGKR